MPIAPFALMIFMSWMGFNPWAALVLTTVGFYGFTQVKVR